MEQLIKFFEDETKKADRRYQSICRDLESGLEAVGGVDTMARRAKEAQKEKVHFNFFNELRARYEADNALDDIPAFKAYCLDVIAGEFSEKIRCQALTDARKLLLKNLTPVLAGME